MVQEVFQRKQEPWRWGAQWLAVESWQWPIERTIWEIAKELNINHSMVIQHLKQTEKVKNLSEWVPHEWTTKQKKHHFEVSLLLFHATTISWLNCDMQWRVDFTWQLEMTSSVGGPIRSSKALPKAKFALKEGHGQCSVVCCPSDPLQLSESWWNH